MSYCNKANVESVFGVTNIANWADLDNDQDGVKIEARIDRAIVVVSAEIDDIIRCVNYQTPLENDSGSTPTTIENLAATLAGLWLYEARGVDDMDQNNQPMHRLRYMQIWARRTLREIAGGTRKLDALQ